MIRKAYSLCSSEKENHKHDSILIKCDSCDEFVWLNLEDINKIPLCIDCATKLSIDNDMNINIYLKKEDIRGLLGFLLEKRNKKEV